MAYPHQPYLNQPYQSNQSPKKPRYFIGIPIAWWGMNDWLENFAYRITIEWRVFALTGLALGTIAFLTVSCQSVRAALVNPVESLRSE